MTALQERLLHRSVLNVLGEDAFQYKFRKSVISAMEKAAKALDMDEVEAKDDHDGVYLAVEKGGIGFAFSFYDDTANHRGVMFLIGGERNKIKDMKEIKDAKDAAAYVTRMLKRHAK